MNPVWKSISDLVSSSCDLITDVLGNAALVLPFTTLMLFIFLTPLLFCIPNIANMTINKLISECAVQCAHAVYNATIEFIF